MVVILMKSLQWTMILIKVCQIVEIFHIPKHIPKDMAMLLTILLLSTVLTQVDKLL